MTNLLRRTLALTALGAVAALPLAACASDSKDSSSGSPAATTIASGDGSLSGGGEVAPDEGSGAGSLPTGSLPTDSRKLIIRITVGVEVDSVQAAVDQVIALAGRHGGELSDSQLDLSNPRTAGGDLVFRVPPAETEKFIAELEPGIGRRVSLQTSKEDVTMQVTDLEARITTTRASIDRVRQLLAQAKNIGEIVALESELTDRETSLESMLAQKAVLDDQVAMSTVTVHLSVTPSEAPVTGDGIGASFRRGWRDFLAFLRGLVVAIGRTLPFLVLLGAVGGGAWGVSRRVSRRNRSAARPNPPVLGEDQRTS
jgi:hypothetical protein